MATPKKWQHHSGPFGEVIGMRRILTILGANNNDHNATDLAGAYLDER